MLTFLSLCVRIRKLQHFWEVLTRVVARLALIWVRQADKLDIVRRDDLGWLLFDLVVRSSHSHFHLKAEDAAFTRAIRMHIDWPIVLPNYRLDNWEAQAEALMVNIILALQLAVAREQLCDVVLSNASPSILNLAYKNTTKHVVGHSDLNPAFSCKLVRILNQVDKYLLEARLISVQYWNLTPESFFVYVNRLIRCIANLPVTSISTKFRSNSCIRGIWVDIDAFIHFWAQYLGVFITKTELAWVSTCVLKQSSMTTIVFLKMNETFDKFDREL